MRTELKRLQRELNLTTIYVTHDQSEALALSHEIAVMSDGFIKQVGTPRQIYETPNSPFVADFVGTTNFIGGTVSSLESGGRCLVSSAVGEIKAHAGEGVAKNKTVIVSVRPEDVELSEQEPAAAKPSSAPPSTTRISSANTWISRSRWAMLCCSHGRIRRCGRRPATRSMCA